MNDVNSSNFRPSYCTTQDKESFNMLYYKSIGILQLAKPRSAGRLWEFWAPVTTILNLTRKYRGTAAVGYQLNIHDMLNMSYNFGGETTSLEYGRVKANLLNIEGIDSDSPSYVYLIKASGGHRIAADGGISGGTTGPGGCTTKGKGKGKW